MALETLKDVNEIGGFRIGRDYESFKEDFIFVDERSNFIQFTIQNGPIKEVGVNGCQVVTMIQAAKLIFEKLNEKWPCIENIETIFHLAQAIVEQENRTKSREARGVEGTSQV